MAEFEINANEATIKPTFSHRHVRLQFSADVSDVVSLLTLEQIVANVDVDGLLAVIGEDRADAYFGLVQPE